MTRGRAKLTYRDALREAHREALARDPRVFLMGEDVGRYGGCYAVSRGPPRRVRPRARPRHAALRVGLRRRRHRRRARRHAPDRRDHDGELQPARARPDREQRRDAAAHVGRPARRAARDPHDDRRRAPARRAALAQPRGLVRARSRACASLAPATLEDARGMLWTALEDPDPVLIFEHNAALRLRGRAAGRRRRRGHRPRARVRRAGPRRHARQLRRHAAARRSPRPSSSPPKGIEAEVHRPAHAAPARRRRRCSTRSRARTARVVVDEGWRSGSLSAEIAARIQERGLLRARRARRARVQRGGADPLRAPSRGRRRCRSVEGIVAAARAHGGPPWLSSACRRSAPTWRPAPCSSGASRPATRVARGQVVALVDTEKAEIEVEIWEDGVVERILVAGRPEGAGGHAAAAAARRREAARPAPAPRRRPWRPHPRRPRRRLGAAGAHARSALAAPLRSRRARSRAGSRASAASTSRRSRGTGPHGAVRASDVDARGRRSAGGGRARPRRRGARSARAGVASMRVAIGDAMARSKREIPHYYLEHDARRLARRSRGSRRRTRTRPVTERLLLGVLLLKATALALRAVPELNGHYVDGAFRPGAGIHVGVAIVAARRRPPRAGAARRRPQAARRS